VERSASLQPNATLAPIPPPSKPTPQSVTEKPPTLETLFNTDFPSVTKISMPSVITSNKSGEQITIKRHVYADYDANVD